MNEMVSRNPNDARLCSTSRGRLAATATKPSIFTNANRTIRRSSCVDWRIFKTDDTDTLRRSMCAQCAVVERERERKLWKQQNQLVFSNCIAQALTENVIPMFVCSCLPHSHTHTHHRCVSAFRLKCVSDNLVALLSTHRLSLQKHVPMEISFFGFSFVLSLCFMSDWFRSYAERHERKLTIFVNAVADD